MRGKEYLHHWYMADTGITPAYAGKSEFEHFLLGMQEDHPRVCGEKELTPHATRHTWGSPPRMRGKGWQRK